MAAPDLSERLDYLVSYSSQLIFVCGESVRQSAVLDHFIAQHSDDVEIALLASSVTTPLAKYREKIYRQLISQSQGANFNLPLNQLLAALNQHQGHVIISVSKAENLPEKLVQELWELVLQSRFASNQQYLSVLLFADESWARQIQQRLRNKTGDKPVLLSSNGMNLARTSKNVAASDLDSMIARKRQQFSQRLAERAKAPQNKPSLLKKKRVIALILCVFVITFCTILSWLYPLQVGNLRDLLWATPELSQSQANQQDVSAITETATAEDQLETTAATKQIALNDQPLMVEEQQQVANLSAEPSQADPLVTDWTTAIHQVEEDASQFLLAKPKMALLAGQQVESKQQDGEQEVEQDDVLIADQSGSISRITSQTPQANVTNNHIAMDLPPLPDELNLAQGQYFIQISAMQDRQSLLEFMNKRQLSSDIWSYTTRRFGGDWHVVLLNHSYPNLLAARRALEELPLSLQALQPFIKSAAQIDKELAQFSR